MGKALALAFRAVVLAPFEIGDIGDRISQPDKSSNDFLDLVLGGLGLEPEQDDMTQERAGLVIGGHDASSMPNMEPSVSGASEN